MNCRKLLFVVVLLFTICSCKNDVTVQGPIPLQVAGQPGLPIPKGWTTEEIPFPIEFAPQIDYTGIEYLRFAPGWEFTTSPEHWAYAFTWWVSGNPNINQKVLEENLVIYYTGLIGRNITKRNIPQNKVTKVVAKIKKIQTLRGDMETYTGTINMLDYLDMMHKTVILNCIVHKKDCSPHTAIMFTVSPQPFGHIVWQQLDTIAHNFACGGK